MSPSHRHISRASASQKVSLKRVAKENTKAYKVRRKQLKDDRNKSIRFQQKREGPTYQRCIGMNAVDQSDELCPTIAFMARPSFELFQTDICDLVYVDIETSGATSEDAASICQSAHSMCIHCQKIK